MSGRQIRRPPARRAANAAPAAARPAGGDGSRAVQRKVLALGLAILLAGTSATFLLEQAVLTPQSQVQAESSLPVYSAVGQRTDDVSFWPWTFYAENAGQTPTLMPAEELGYTSELLATLATALLDGSVEIDTADLSLESYSTNTASCMYLRDAPLVWTPADGNAQTLTLNFGAGGGSDPSLSFGMAVSLVMRSAQPPTEAQLEAAYRQVLLDLYFQCGAAGWLLEEGAGFERIEATPSPADVTGERAASSMPSAPPADGALSDEARRRLEQAAQLPLSSLMDRLSGPLAETLTMDEYVLQWPEGLGPDTALWPLDGSPSPAALAEGTLGENDTRRLEQQLQQQYAEYGVELQVVTLSDSVLVLFSTGAATLGFYYDPVLEAWSGVAVQ